MYIKLDDEVASLFCCSFCKGDLQRRQGRFLCLDCGLEFPQVEIETDESQAETVFDFRLHRPTYCQPPGIDAWDAIQSHFESYHDDEVSRDSLDYYMAEIDSVSEIYTEEFHLTGAVLDVGGHQGRLRYFLGEDVGLYVSADPFASVFSGIGKQANLLHAYPCLKDPCNFVVASAENLPFKSKSFDWVHMRSVVDHFADPYAAFLEAYRCCRVGGQCLVGLSIVEKKRELEVEGMPTPDGGAGSYARRLVAKVKRDGVFSLLPAIYRRLRNSQVGVQETLESDDHMFRLSSQSLVDLFERTGWAIAREHWQKPPFQYCVYACGEKKDDS